MYRSSDWRSSDVYFLGMPLTKTEKNKKQNIKKGRWVILYSKRFYTKSCLLEIHENFPTSFFGMVLSTRVNTFVLVTNVWSDMVSEN